MISVDEARRICLRHAPQMPAEFRPLELAVGAFAAADVFAIDDFPRFSMSAVDGYAVGDALGPWVLKGHVAAGQRHGARLSAGECVRIFTGAAVPDGAVAVAMQERVLSVEGRIVLASGDLQPGANVRLQGESFRTGELLVAKGRRIDAASVGLMASGGVQELMVALEPQLGIVRTGDEFIDDAQRDAGRIHSSNDRMLIAAAREAWLQTDDVAYTAGDDRAALRAALRQAADENDLVVATGGVSVGDHDLMRPVLEELGARVHFHGVKQKPGKPMLFATLGRKPVFALPGNPRAVLVCWYVYVLPFIRAMQGAGDPWPRTEQLHLMDKARLKDGRAEFRAAQVIDGMVHLLPDEGSHMLTTLALADGLAYFPEGASGEHFTVVDFIHLPEP